MSKERSKDFSIHDLKIGNIVNYETEGDLLPTVIDWQALKWLTEDPIGFNMVHSPIPLTEKWLLEFGFNKDYKQGYIGKDFSNQDFVLAEPLTMGEWQKGYAFEFTAGGWSRYKEFNYVHELQNFYYSSTGVMLSLS